MTKEPRHQDQPKERPPERKDRGTHDSGEKIRDREPLSTTDWNKPPRPPSKDED